MEEISDDENKKEEKEEKKEKEEKEKKEKKEEKENIKEKKENIKEEDINTLTKKLEEKFTIEDTMNISFKKLISKNILYCSLRYDKYTKYNPYDNDICFSISLEDKPPYKIIDIKCLSNFRVPSLCDNRNLYKAIMKLKSKKINSNEEEQINTNEKDNKDKDKDKENLNKINVIDANNGDWNDIYSLEKVINLIPEFIGVLRINDENKNLYKLGSGEYDIDKIYEMNDFLINWKNNFYRGKQIMDSKEYNRYIIITDIYFILLSPLEEFKNKGKLIFYGYLYKCEKKENITDKNIIKLIWSDKNNEDFLIEIEMENKQQVDELLLNFNKKIEGLTKRYTNLKLPNK